MIADFSTIVARNMGIRRGGRWILRPTTFGITSGVVGLAGPPSSGRSSLLATLATLRRPTVGALELLGHDVTGPAGQRAVRPRLGLLPDRFGWAAGVTAREYVAYAAYFKATPKHAVDAILERFELTDAAELEMGMLPADLRLRAGLAATCVHRPGLVLLDEPLTSIAEPERDELIGVLRGLAPAVVVTAPDPAELTGWCDRVFSIVRARLIESLEVSRSWSRVPAGV
jgi:ABC-2 type transport system ATP-binding protein